MGLTRLHIKLFRVMETLVSIQNQSQTTLPPSMQDFMTQIQEEVSDGRHLFLVEKELFYLTLKKTPAMALL